MSSYIFAFLLCKDELRFIGPWEQMLNRRF